MENGILLYLIFIQIHQNNIIPNIKQGLNMEFTI